MKILYCIPKGPVTSLKNDALRKLIDSRSALMRNSEIARAKKAYNYLTKGAPSHQKRNLQAIRHKLQKF